MLWDKVSVVAFADSSLQEELMFACLVTILCSQEQTKREEPLAAVASEDQLGYNKQKWVIKFKQLLSCPHPTDNISSEFPQMKLMVGAGDESLIAQACNRQ